LSAGATAIRGARRGWPIARWIRLLEAQLLPERIKPFGRVGAWLRHRWIEPAGARRITDAIPTKVSRRAGFLVAARARCIR
jgi:hypothetical protein